MGQTPAKFFPPPLPYGQSPDSNALTKAIAPPPAPQQNFLPLNAPDPSAQQQPQTAQQQGFGGGGVMQRRQFMSDWGPAQRARGLME